MDVLDDQRQDVHESSVQHTDVQDDQRWGRERGSSTWMCWTISAGDENAASSTQMCRAIRDVQDDLDVLDDQDGQDVHGSIVQHMDVQDDQ